MGSRRVGPFGVEQGGAQGTAVGLRFGFVARIGVTGWCRYPTPKIRLVVSLKCFLTARSAVSLGFGLKASFEVFVVGGHQLVGGGFPPTVS